MFLVELILRNVELTGPHFHNGGASSLLQVVEFYDRGGNFPQNGQNLDPDIAGIPGLQGNPAAKESLVEFLLTLTDERVRNESAPFDHPQLILPNGAQDSSPAQAVTLRLPAVGSGERTGQGAQGTATIGTANAKVNYMPPAGFAGIDAFTYTITSSGPLSVTVSVSVTVHASNLPPVAVSGHRHRAPSGGEQPHQCPRQ